MEAGKEFEYLLMELDLRIQDYSCGAEVATNAVLVLLQGAVCSGASCLWFTLK